MPEARLIRSEVREENRVLAGEAQAGAYLDQKLQSLLVERLTAIGFEPAEAVRIAARARIADRAVRGHAERVHGSGLESSKITETTLFDVLGSAEVLLQDADLACLVAGLERRPLATLDDVVAFRRVFAGLRALDPGALALGSLARKTQATWLAILGRLLESELGPPVAPVADPETLVKALERVAPPLQEIRAAYLDLEGFAPLEQTFTSAALRALKAVTPKADNRARLEALLGRLRAIGGDAVPELGALLERDLELAWRDRLVSLDDAQTAFAELRSEFLAFLSMFPKSSFRGEIEKRFLGRWSEALIRAVPASLPGLLEMGAEVALFEERFKDAPRLSEVKAALGRRCLSVLKSLPEKGLGLEELERARATCDPVMPASDEVVAIRARLLPIEQRKRSAREEASDRKALADLKFFVEWDRALSGLPWAKARSKWQEEGKFRSRWDKGRDAGADCRCTVEPDAPCRVFQGPGGGFEVVARFYDERLAGVDLCEVLTGDSLSALYQFFAKRYKKAHSASEAASFLAAAGGTLAKVRFERAGVLEVDLERQSELCTVRYRSTEMQRKEAADDKAVRETREVEEHRAREDRLKRGWNAGDCVRWECTPSCNRGSVRNRQGTRYEVSIAECPRNPQQVGVSVTLAGELLFDCQ